MLFWRNMIKTVLKYFTPFEKLLLILSIFLILLSFFLFDTSSPLTLIASLIGVVSLVLGAKGNPISQVLMILFSLLYGYISYSFSYYGEMITYLGMSMPMAVFSLVSWLRNSYNGKKSQVKVAELKKNECYFMFIITFIVTIAFYFILKYFNTANLLPSTFSVSTSFLAVYLTFRRNPFFAFAYALNDMVLIVLWILAALEDISYVSVIICFFVFLVNDLYGFINWQRMKKEQQGS